MIFLLTLSLIYLTLSSCAPSNRQLTNKNPILLISLDGFRASKLDEFIQQYPNSALKKLFVDVGVKADYMTPTFPSLTFPNHFSIVTGLYNENHGITGNTIYDPEYNLKVNLIGGQNSLEKQWWNRSEPIWLTARNQGLKTSSFFWVGSEVLTRSPDVYLTYRSSYDFLSRCDEVVNWFKKFQMDFVTLYFNEPDSTGHTYGPDSNEYANQLLEMDKILEYLIQRLEQESILDNLNIVIVSDHGMASMLQNGTQLIGNYLDVSWIDSSKTIYGVVSNIYPKNESLTENIIQSLSIIPNLKVFHKNQLPTSFHYSNSDRIAPIVTISDEGFSLSTTNQILKGNHGFNNSIDSMKAIFLARGPNFMKNKKINGFNNVDVYPLFCSLLQIKCNPNNGTIESFADAIVETPEKTTTTTVVSNEPTQTSQNNNSTRINSKDIHFILIFIVYFLIKLMKF